MLPGASTGSGTPSASKTAGSTGRWLQSTAESSPATTSSTRASTELPGRALLAQSDLDLELPAGRVGVGPDGLQATGAARADDPRDVVRRQDGDEALGLVAPGLDQRAQPVVLAPALAGPGLAVAQDDDRLGLAADLACLDQGGAVVLVGQSLERLGVGDPLDPVDLGVGAVAADVVVAHRATGPVGHGLVAAPGDRVALRDSAGPSRTWTPVSSETSRTAAAVTCSPRSSLPLGKDQSS